MLKGRYLELDFNVENIKIVEIVWWNGYYLYYIFDNELNGVVVKGINIVGVDLGEIYLIVSVINEGVGFILFNREGRSIK